MENKENDNEKNIASRGKRLVVTVFILVAAVLLGSIISFYVFPYIKNREENVQTSNTSSGNNILADLENDNQFEQQDTNTQLHQPDTLASSEDNMEEEESEITLSPVKVKGIYVTGPRAGMSQYMDELIELVETTELNTMVIDIKNDSGEITYNMDLEMSKEIGANVKYIHYMDDFVKKLKEKDIYLIARIVAFKDPVLAEKKPELSLRNKDGSIFRDKAGLAWVNPYKKEVWEYLLDVGQKAAELGFDEIQFDYIRFSTDSGMKNVTFGEEAEGKSKVDIITEFTKYACDTLKPLGVFVSADVYGTIIDSDTDAQIVGQDYTEMAKYLDYISPMVYPSHYVDGAYGIQYPDKEPYALILKSMEASKETLNVIGAEEHKAIVRPWLQDFTAKWLTHYKSYGADEIKEQIQAVYDAGYEEWILWNGSNNYTKSGLAKQ